MKSIMVADKPYKGNRGDKGVGSTESVKDPILPFNGFVDLVPPVGRRPAEVGRRKAEWHSRHFQLFPNVWKQVKLNSTQKEKIHTVPRV